MKLTPVVLLVVSCVLFSGCGVYKVTRQGNEAAGNQAVVVGGVPFLTRVPVTYQVTKLVQTRWKVQYVLKINDVEHRVPETPIEVRPGTDTEQALMGILESLEKSRIADIAAFRRRVNAEIVGNRSALNTCNESGVSGTSCGNPSVENSILTSNALVVRTEVSGDQYYINSRRPLIGKATANVEIAADGTLAKSEAEVESKTVETFASLFPFVDLSKKVLKLGDNALAGSGGVSSYKNNNWSNLGTSLDTISVTCEIVSEPWLYVLQSRINNRPAVLGSPLAYNPTGGVELLEAGKVAAAATKEGGKEGKGWSFSGSLVPPDPKTGK